MLVLIPAKGSSKRIPRKNMQPLGKLPLIGWVIDKARGWFPDATTYVATEDRETIRYAKECGCEIWPITEDDVQDRRDGTDLLIDFATRHEDRPILFMQPTSPFTFRRDVRGALADPRPCLWSGWSGVIHNVEHRQALSQDIPTTHAYTGNFLVINRGSPTREDFMGPDVLYPVNQFSMLDINTPADLDLARWIARFVRPGDFA